MGGVRQVLGMGIAILIAGCSAAQPRQGIQQQQSGVSIQKQDPEVPEDIRQIRAEINRFYHWLKATDQLLTPLPSYRPRVLRQLDPDTLEPLPDPSPPTMEEIIKELNEMLKDPAFRQQLEESWKDSNNLVEMPAGSPSPEPTPPAGSRDSTWPGVRAACTG